MTNQEMFDKAYRGLAAQGFQQSLDDDMSQCVYNNNDGKHCAWGHVDPSLTYAHEGLVVEQLHGLKVGVAGTLDWRGLEFATALQKAHDGAKYNSVKDALINVAKLYDLTVPDVG